RGGLRRRRGRGRGGQDVGDGGDRLQRGRPPDGIAIGHGLLVVFRRPVPGRWSCRPGPAAPSGRGTPGRRPTTPCGGTGGRGTARSGAGPPRPGAPRGRPRRTACRPGRRGGAGPPDRRCSAPARPTST